MISSILYATKDLVTDLATSLVMYFEQIGYIVKDSFAKNEPYDIESFEEEVVPKKKKKSRKKSK
jgi:hypothetical protein